MWFDWGARYQRGGRTTTYPRFDNPTNPWLGEDVNRTIALLVVAVLALVALLFWKMSANPADPKVNVDRQTDASVKGVTTTTTPTKGPPVATKAAPKADSGGDLEGELIDPKSDLFNHRIDVTVGDKLRATAAFECDESGMPPNSEIHLNYKVRIAHGRVTVSDIKVLKSEVTPDYQRCFIDAVQKTSFQMDDMPDFEEGDQDLYTKVRSLKKYRSRAEFDRE